MCCDTHGNFRNLFLHFNEVILAKRGNTDDDNT